MGGIPPRLKQRRTKLTFGESYPRAAYGGLLQNIVRGYAMAFLALEADK